MAAAMRWHGVGLVVALGIGSAAGQSTSQMSVDSAGTPGDWNSDASDISADGRYVVFRSEANNLVPGGTVRPQIFVHDRHTGQTTVASVNDAGEISNGWTSHSPVISADGRFVAFFSFGSNLVPGENGQAIFLRDLQAGHTSVLTHGSGPSISAQGQFAVFSSGEPNLVPGDTNGSTDVFRRNLQTGVVIRVSLDSGGNQGNFASYAPSPRAISADGRFVTFSSVSNFAPNDTNGTSDVFVRDLQTTQTIRVSVDSSGAEANDSSGARAITPDGRYVMFLSNATNLVPDDTNGVGDFFVRDLLTGETSRVPIEFSHDEPSDLAPSISDDGRYVAFSSSVPDLVPNDTNGAKDAFVYDLQTEEITRVSVSSTGVQGNSSTFNPRISGDGSCVTFWSFAGNLVPGGTGFTDTFVHDRFYTAYTSFCWPGENGTSACPCSNPPSGFRRGCDNSSATGGASLSGSGVAYLWTDSLVFTTAGEKPTALSILIQGTTSIPAGVVYGQGLRCLTSGIKRLYTKSAVGGSIVAPDTGAGELAVSARSAGLGDPIPAAATRYYLVYYRDPIVLGGCPATSTFNATQTGQVTWYP